MTQLLYCVIYVGIVFLKIYHMAFSFFEVLFYKIALIINFDLLKQKFPHYVYCLCNWEKPKNQTFNDLKRSL